MNNRAIQEKILEIFVELDKICNKYDLRYYAIGGTCLGAIRHKGFIPWDDDLDIAMPRPDYEAFKRIAKEQLPDNLQIFDVGQGEHYESRFMKVQNVTTTFVQRGMIAYPDRYTGVYVDIMPLDGIPDGKWKRKRYFFALRQLGRLDDHRKFQDRGNNRLKRMFWMLTGFLLKRFPVNYFCGKYVKLQKKYTYEDTADLCYTWSWRAAKLIFPKEDFKDYVLVPFEDVQMRCPIGYDDFLTILFGDYMQLPPKEKRIAVHETDILDLDRPFTYYTKGV